MSFYAHSQVLLVPSIGANGYRGPAPYPSDSESASLVYILIPGAGLLLIHLVKTNVTPLRMPPSPARPHHSCLYEHCWADVSRTRAKPGLSPAPLSKWLLQT